MSNSKNDKQMKQHKRMEEETRPDAQDEINAEEYQQDSQAPDSASGQPAAGNSPPPGDMTDSEQLDRIHEELKQAQEQAQENLDGWQRALAEFANYKKRTERESSETRSRLKGEILLPLLDIYDDLKLALLDKPQDGDASQWAAGIEMIHSKFQTLLQNMEVEVIDQKEVPFDPNLHEAITYEESEDVQEGHVIDVFQSGYRIGERVIRPARVRVAR